VETLNIAVPPQVPGLPNNSLERTQPQRDFVDEVEMLRRFHEKA
jgi:hypothetical protein